MKDEIKKYPLLKLIAFCNFLPIDFLKTSAFSFNEPVTYIEIISSKQHFLWRDSIMSSENKITGPDFTFKVRFLLLMTVSLLNLNACAAENNEPAESTLEQGFNQYWYSNKAELTHYDLNQARYGEMRKGDAVLIFVTEDFLKDKQVKYEFGDKHNAVPVLKLNFTRKFYTGIYPYSVMTSIFTPVDYHNNPTIKVTASMQEWCGHSFLQLNNRGNKYDIQLRSYFQSEGDQEFQIERSLLEDEVWTRIRLNPQTLPTGDIEIIPGTQFARFRHFKLMAEKATATLKTTEDSKLSDSDIQIYTLNYKNIKRRLTIKFEKAFPHHILAWEETTMSGFGKNAKLLTTTAVRTKSLMLDYWRRNKLSDAHFREELGLIY